MFDFNDPSIIVQMCKFQAFIQRAHIVIKFPCSYFVQWKTINNRYSICTQKRVRTANDEAIFNEKLTFYTEMVYNTKKKEYYSKETFLVLNLVSKSRPDQVKLVGRISVDLAQILNRRRFEELSRLKLNYCSVQGSIVFCIGLLNKRDSNLSVKDLDRSAFTDYFSLNPINRMMIEESITGNYINSNNRSLQKIQRYEQQQHQNGNSYNQQSSTVPSFAKVIQTQPKNQQNRNPYEQKNTYQKQQRDDEVISFQNSQKHQQNLERLVNESPRTNNSREQSLIEKLQENNFKKYEKGGNVVQVKNRQARTERTVNDDSRTKVLNKVTQEVESGQIKKQAVLNKVSSQSRIPPPSSQPITLPKPTSPPSHQRQLTHQNSSSKFSQTSEYQNEQLLSIVQKLEQQKQQQQSMIQSLKSMLLNKNMKKKQGRGVSQVDDVQQQNKQREIVQENQALRGQNELLVKQIERKNSQLKQKDMHIFQFLDKIKKLQGELRNCEEKINAYQDQIAQLHLREIEQQKICESLKLSVSMQGDQWGLSKRKDSGADLQPMNLLGKKSSKLLQTFKVPQVPSIKSPSQATLQKFPQQQAQETGQQFKITITKDENIYEDMQRENTELSERVKQLQQEVQIYKDLLKQQNQQQSLPLKQSIPIVVPVQSLAPQQQQQVPFTITVSKNINIYENYQNLEQENTELYDKIKELELQIQSYKELMREENYPEEKKKAEEKEKMVESMDVQQVGEYRTSINHIPDMTESQPPKRLMNAPRSKQPSPFQTTPSPTVSEQHMNMVAETFKIILTKDKNIYKEQQEQNIQLSNRVIELQEQLEKYKDLIKSDNENHAHNGQTNGQSSPQQQQHYEDQGFTITLSKDKNIFENQQKQITEFQTQVRQLQQIVQKYKTLYGPLEKQPQYKISVTRQQNIYEDQQREIKQLLKSLDHKDCEVMQLTARLSILQRQLQEYHQPTNDGEIKICIKRDENIYDEQEKDIRELSSRAVQLQDKVSVLCQELKEKESCVENLQQQLTLLKQHQQQHKKPLNQVSSIAPSTTTQHSTSFSTPSLSCLSCVSLQNRILQLQMNVQLIEEQKNLLEEEIGALEEEKFCLTSTQNQLKITIEDLSDQINLLSQQNERLSQELHFVQQNYHLQHMQNQPVQNIQNLEENIDADTYNDAQLQQQQVPQQVVNRSKFAISLPQNVFKQYNRTHMPQLVSPHSSTHHLQQLPQSPSNSKYSKKSEPKSQASQKQSKVIISLQQQNSHLRQSLSTFEQQLQQQYFTIGQLEQRISRLMHEKQILFERDQQLSKEIIMLSQKQQQVNDREIGFKQRISELQKELTSLRSQSLTTITTSHITNTESPDKFRVTQLEHEVETLRGQLSMARQAVSLQENTSWLLREKQQQIEELQRQLQALNDSLNELSTSYQSMQQNLAQLQEQKQSQVQEIREQYETVNRMLRQQLQSIEKMVLEKQMICQENQGELRARGEEIQHLFEQIQEMKRNNNSVDEVNTLREEMNVLCNDNQCMKKEISTLTQFKQQFLHLQQQLNRLKQIQLQATTKLPLSTQQRQKFLALLQQLKLSKQHRDLQLTQLLPMISQKLNHIVYPQQATLYEQPLAKMISKEIQKIKINIMRNYQNTNTATGGVIQRSSPNKNGYGQDFKTFAEKSAMLNYLKPIEDLIKGY